MKRRCISISELAIIAGTRAALGAGVGLLVADKLDGERRKGVGWTLLGVGLLSSIPIFAEIFGRGSESDESDECDERDREARYDDGDDRFEELDELREMARGR